MKRIIAIHQPNFFPYMGFFQKMMACDVFVIMGHCQFEKQNYQNRFKINKDVYAMSVTGEVELIKHKRYLNAKRDYEKIKERLPKYRDLLERFDWCIDNDLYNTNTIIIHQIAAMMGISVRIEEDYPTGLHGTRRLLHICENYGATHYLSGPSGIKYLDTELFAKAGIDIITQQSSEIIPKPILEVLYERAEGNNK